MLLLSGLLRGVVGVCCSGSLVESSRLFIRLVESRIQSLTRRLSQTVDNAMEISESYFQLL